MTPDPPTTEMEPAPRGGFLGFLTSIPGILTGVAAVISALATLYAVHVGSGGSEPAIPEPAQPIPEASAPVDAASVATRVDTAPVADDATLDDEAATLVADCASGFADACITLLDLLAEECYYGDAISCDALYWISPVGSAYEAYGATCGGRFGGEFAGRCSEL
ncbi:MAG TPA: hypothetical protein VHF92_10835 [Geodermatophilus sp.]|nr:hypothetical protein [Geodermatophilus sp.]